MTEDFIREWAETAWNLSNLFEGTLSGGIAPVKRMINCKAKGNTAEISYDLPRACGLSDVRYHVTEPDKVRTDRFVFTGDGKIRMNGVLFPGAWKDDPWLEKEAGAFLEDYSAAFSAHAG